MEALIQREIVPDAILPALRRGLEIRKMADDPSVYLLHRQCPRRSRFYSHEDETGERVGWLLMGLKSGGERHGRGGGRFDRRAGR